MDQLLTERPPAHVGLDAVHQDHVAGRAVGAGAIPGRRPASRATRSCVVGQSAMVLSAFDLDHGRPVDLEVVEILGIDGAEWSRLPGQTQLLHHPGGCVARVVPALEGGNGDRRYELADVVELDCSPPPVPTLGCPIQPTWSVLLIGLPGGVSAEGYGKFTRDAYNYSPKIGGQ